MHDPSNLSFAYQTHVMARAKWRTPTPNVLCVAENGSQVGAETRKEVLAPRGYSSEWGSRGQSSLGRTVRRRQGVPTDDPSDPRAQ
jgi:hypothetical protein